MQFFLETQTLRKTKSTAMEQTARAKSLAKAPASEEDSHSYISESAGRYTTLLPPVYHATHKLTLSTESLDRYSEFVPRPQEEGFGIRLLKFDLEASPFMFAQDNEGNLINVKEDEKLQE